MKMIWILVALLAFGAGVGPAQAASCGLSGAGSVPIIAYDPFMQTPLSVQNVTLTLTRTNAANTGKGAEVDFYLQAPDDRLDGAVIIPRSVSGNVTVQGLGGNVFYDHAASPPVMIAGTSQPSGTGRFLKIQFNDNIHPTDTVSVSFDVLLPANLNLAASSALPLDTHFACRVASNAPNQTGVLAGGMVLPIRVLSALRAYYAGAALEFGEIGAVTTASLAASPRRTGSNNAVIVQSSGAYSVSLSSANGFTLQHGGNGSGNDAIAYSVLFLGMTADDTTTPAPDAPAIKRVCRPTGMVSPDRLALQATLKEGGAGKNPSSTYGDILTITITPLIDSDPGITACGAYSAP